MDRPLQLSSSLVVIARRDCTSNPILARNRLFPAEVSRFSAPAIIEPCRFPGGSTTNQKLLPMNLTHNFGTCLAALTLTAPSLALADLWVDPVHGSDGSAGTSPAAPLKTMGEATGRAAAGDVVYLLPGVYAESSGETFPVDIPSQVRIESVSGRAATTVDAQGADSTVAIFQCREQSELYGVTVVRSGGNHLAYASGSTSSYPQIHECEFIAGDAVLAASDVAIAFENCTMRGQSIACLSLESDGDQESMFMSLSHCDLRDSSRGILIRLTHDFALVSIDLDRCSLVDNPDAAIDLLNLTFREPELFLRGCLLARNGTGVKVHDGGLLTPTLLIIDHCTVTDHTRYGLDLRETKVPHSVVRNSIVANSGNRDTYIDAYGPIRVRDTLVGDSLLHGPGNLTGDPGFVASGADNFSLRADSPCLDAAVAGPSTPPTDLTGHPRTLDSDLDLIPLSDLGALEHAPLIGPDVLRLGLPAQLGLSGPAGGFSTLIIAPGGYAPFGSTTLFGRLFIQPNGAFRVTPVMTTGGAPTWVDVSALIDPSWVGTTIGFQALPRSFAAPAGGAYSNPLLISVE